MHCCLVLVLSFGSTIFGSLSMEVSASVASVDLEFVHKCVLIS